ncbi:hypothetical protein D3C84_948440 [compost metagenome]
MLGAKASAALALMASGAGGVKGAGVWLLPINTVPEPAITTLPWLPTVPSVAAGMPLISTVGITLPASALPQAVGSPWRAAGRPSN